MADITVRLIWYRLGEGYKNAGEKYDRFLEWCDDFSWRRVDVLDMLFLGWLLAAFLVVGAINLYLRFFGLPRSRKAAIAAGEEWRTGGFGGAGGVATTTPGVTAGEGCQWLNAALSWLYLHYNHTPELVEAWIRALNEHSRKHMQGDLQLKFERVQPGSAPPRLVRVSTDSTNRNLLLLQASIEAKDSVLTVSALQNTATNLKVTNCDVTIKQLLGQLQLRCQYSNEDIHVTAFFPTPPTLKLDVKARNYDSGLDLRRVESVVRSAICEAQATMTLSARGGQSPFGMRPDLNSTFNSGTHMSGRPQDRRLLVKVIKANGLGDKDFGSTDPYCVVQVDYPPQKHTTSVVKNTVNPFWDEHFLLNVDDTTRQIKLDVFDREKPPGEDFLGGASIGHEELRRLPSSRQIIPLTGRPRATTTTSGSITTEFLFMDAAEAASLGVTPAGVGMGVGDLQSARRRIDTNRLTTPTGTVITTTTTTTEKPRDHRTDPFYHESPNRIEKTDSTSGVTGDYSPFSSRGSSHLGAHDAALSASQVPPVGSRTLMASPRLTLTHPEVRSGPYSTSENPMYEDHRHDTLSMSTTASGEPKADAKKKGFAATLKKRFARPKKTRSQSADARAHSFREQALLKPPEYVDTGPQSYTAEDLDRAQLHDGSLRKSRSHSFSNSFKKLFKRKKKGEGSRESSLSRGGIHSTSREPSMSAETPQLSYRDGDRRQLTMGGAESGYTHDNYGGGEAGGYQQYSTSVPSKTSPLYS